MASGYLTTEHLTGFEHYKYNALDTSPLSNYIMHPFWNTVVKLCPSWLAPNVLTFSGFLFTVFNFLLFTWYDYSFFASSRSHPESLAIPRWVWIVVAVSHFLAHTLDGIDGKQARRTRSSSPLGELFDHGLDSWCTIFTPVCLYSVFGREEYSIPPFYFFLCLWSVFFTFISSHWEKYNTGVLYLPWAYDFSLTLSLVAYLITYIHGVEIWKYDIPGIGISTGFFVATLMHVGTYTLSLPVSLFNIFISYRDRTGKMRSPYEANRPLVSSVIFFFITLMWSLWSPNDIINTHPRCFYLMMGTVFSNISCRLIVSQMSNTRCELFNCLMLPVAAVAFASVQFRLGSTEVVLLYGLTALSILAHCHYGVIVVQQICRHFNLNCFRLKRPSDD